jgi:hypothetical protein
VPYKDKLLTRSILIDDSIHDIRTVHVLMVHIRASGNYSHGPTRLEVSYCNEELIIAKNTVRQVFAKATSKSDHLGRVAKVAKRLIVNSCLTILAERRLLGIEIPNEHLWMVQELCNDGGRITGSEHDGGSKDLQTGWGQ